MKVVFSDRAYTAVLAETLSKVETETGGVFLGKYMDGIWYIVESVDPGPNSIFQVDYFEYDQKYIQHLINKKALLYGAKLELIGLWHRHPGTFDIFSRTDDGTNSQYAAMRAEGAVSMLVNLEPEFRFTIYHVAQPCRYTKIESYEVGDNLFPRKLLEYKNITTLLNRLNGKSIDANCDRKSEPEGNKSLDEVINIILPELMEKYVYYPKMVFFNMARKEDYSKMIAEIVASDILFLSDRYGIKFYSTKLPNRIIVAQGSGQEKIELFFTYNKKEETVLVSYRDNTYYYKEGLFEKLIRKVLQNEI